MSLLSAAAPIALPPCCGVEVRPSKQNGGRGTRKRYSTANGALQA